MASYSNAKEKIQQSTPFIDKLLFDGDLEFSDSDFKADNIKINKEICDELEKERKCNFLERSAFPNEKVLVQLARRVYEETDTGKELNDMKMPEGDTGKELNDMKMPEGDTGKELNDMKMPEGDTGKKLYDMKMPEGDTGKELNDMKMPEGWRLLTTAFNKHTLNNYFGAAYWNPEQQQIVVAHRGTDWNVGSLWADIRGILKNNYVRQMNSAITFAHKIKVIVEELNKRDDVFLQLSFTGHSLGGWLAQITTLTTKYFTTEKIDNKLLFVKSKTVGYHAHTVVFDNPGCEKMLSRIIDNFDLRYEKNCNSFEINDLDITTYLSAPNLVNTCTKHIGSLYRVFIEYTSPNVVDLKNYTLTMHGIKGIKEVFFSDKIKETQKVTDWPLVSENIIIRALKKLANKIFELASVCINIVFTWENRETLPFTNEYEYFHLLADEVNNYNPDPDDKKGYCVIRYQLEKVDKTICSKATFSQPELDFLNQYKILRDDPAKRLKNVLHKFGDESNKMKGAFKNFNMDEGKKVIRCNSENELKKLIRYVKCIIRFSPGTTSEIENTLRDDPVWFRVEKLNEPFIGRTKELEQLLHTYIRADEGIAMPVITGLEGVGKSELALKYAREYYGKDSSIIWINAESEEAQKSSFIQLHKKLILTSRKEDGEENMELIIDDVYDYLKRNKKSSIFIFDNAKNYTEIEKSLPKGLHECDKVHVLITTNNSSHDWKLNQRKIEALQLKDFNDEEATIFVKSYLNITDSSQDENINSLIQTLHKFPLALQQAVAYIKSMKEARKVWNIEYNISDYLKEYEEEPKKMLGSEKEDRNKGVFSTLNMTINKINEKFGKKALDMLDIISYFAPDYIPREIFINKLTNIDELIMNTQPLIEYSIVHLENGMLNVHGLVQQFMKLKIEERKKKNSEATSEEKSEEEVLKKTLQLLTEHIAVCKYKKDEKDAEKKEREKIELCTPHVVSVWNHAYKYPKLIEEFLIGGKNIKISKTGPALSVPYFNFIAAASKDEIVKEIIDKIGEKEKFLEQSIKAGKKARSIAGNIVKDLIDRRNNDKECALHGAAKNGKKQTVEFLVSKGADVNAKKKYGWTPLSLAVYNGHLSIVEHLLENNAKIGIQRTGREYTELHFASKNGNVEMVDLLLSKGADVNIPQKDFKPTVNYPIKKDVNASQKVPEVNVSKKDADAGKKTPQEVAYVNARDQRQYTALHFAVKNNHSKIIELLLKDKRIDVNAETEWKLTPLHFAVKTSNLESVKILVEKGACVNAKKKPDGFTPVQLAVLDCTQNTEIIKYLLHREDIEINAQTTEGNTALHLVAKKGNLEVVEILIKKGVDSTIENNDGKLASDLADENGHSEVKSYIDQNRKFSNESHDQGREDEISTRKRKFVGESKHKKSKVKKSVMK